MKTYNYFTLGAEDAYGQPQMTPEHAGTIKMAINLTSQSIQDNINYKDSSYIGLTLNKSVNDTYLIEYGDLQLKVLYVNPLGRYTQVFMSET